ncbi:2-C-methyl-D-erythritol 4-phosphate cytidylyltransferase [Actinotalea solisilvae]|uniref:2-C-methyl-D-erythritol 4-phosphate cytidylyltransferase n=1 Tax=Actinotalea solisilvae TaxID=2072922 RepID=UPI0018F26C77|nr:2-C-methyl-D-erythritol 4-phosphate cytidylyltransferase [Actinotalea solisilvae]
MRVAAVLTAAGSGSRLGSDLPKALVPLAGEPVVAHAARALVAAADLTHLVVTAPPAHVVDVAAALAGLAPGGCRVDVVPGGPSRQASVAAGLAAVVASGDLAPADVVLVHDAARPLVGADAVRRVVAAAARHGAAIPGLAVTDTVKVVDDAGRVTATPDRRTLRAVQTPQGFTLDVLRRAHEAGRDRAHDEATAATDDAGLVEALGLEVRVVDGDPRAVKITTAADLALAERLLHEDAAPITTAPGGHR